MGMRFTKMHGLGNDFVVIDTLRQPFDARPERVRALANRRFGVGCDQVLLIEKARLPDTEFHYRIFNADGGEVEQCGNGARCFARYVYERGLTQNRTIVVGTTGGPITLTVEADHEVRVDMGRPRFAPAEIPFDADAQAMTYPVAVGGRTIELGALSMGNPHAVIRVDAVDQAPVETLGPLIERHPRFPQRTNVGFMAVRSPEQIDLRVYERGTGETLACGTGACAAVVHGRQQGWLGPTVAVDLPGGRLVISWRTPEESVSMRGPATFVFDGTVDELDGMVENGHR